MGAFDAGFIPPITDGAEAQIERFRKSKKPKAWQRLRERGIQGVATGEAGLTSAPVVSTGAKSDDSEAELDEVDEKSLLKPWKDKPKKPAPFKPNAYDGNNNGLVQDGTIHERPALPKKPVVRKRIDWQFPLLGDLMLKKHRETHSRLRDRKGHYIKPRRQFHGKVVNWYLKRAGTPKPEGERTLYFMGGGPASLKSTLLKSGKTGIPDGVLKIDSDEIKEFIPEYREWVETGYSGAANLTQAEAKHMTQLVTHTLLNNGNDITLDTTGDGNYKGFKERLEGLRSNGHRIVAHYTTNDIETALKLNEERFKQTGRKVPESNVRYIHEQVSRNVPQALREGLFDELYLYDTNDLEKGPKLILSSKDGKIKIHDPVAYKKFLKKGEIPPPPPPKEGVPGKPIVSSGKPKTPQKPTHGWQPKLGFSDGKPHKPKGTWVGNTWTADPPEAGPFDEPPVNPNLPAPYGKPKDKP
jgi:predicted ABC-type ATPase